MATEVSERHRTVSFDRSTKLCHSTTPVYLYEYSYGSVDRKLAYAHGYVYDIVAVRLNFIGRSDWSLERIYCEELR